MSNERVIRLENGIEENDSVFKSVEGLLVDCPVCDNVFSPGLSSLIENGCRNCGAQVEVDITFNKE